MDSRRSLPRKLRSVASRLVTDCATTFDPKRPCLDWILPQIVHTRRQCRLELALISFALLSIAIHPILPPVDVDHFLVVGA